MVPLNPRMTGPEVDYIVGHSGARGLVLDDALAGIADGVAPRLHSVLSIGGTSLGPSYDEALASARAVDPRIAIDENDPFCVAYTSGTTGKPKGVLISHRSRSLTFTMSALEYGLGTGRRSIAVAPMYHGAGFAFGYAPVYTGGTVSMLRSWDPESFLAMIERDRAQSVFLVPTHAQMIRNLTEEPGSRFDLSSLDTIYFNAAALPTPLKEWVLDAFPGVGIHELYGSTEGGIISNLRPLDARRKAGSVGHPWHFTEVRVVDDEGQPVAPGEPGELFSRSPYLMNGYLDDPEATAACTTDDGFLTCGDVVTVDDEGYIRIVDRKKDLIISGGVNVYPRDVEEAVLTLPRRARGRRRRRAARDVGRAGRRVRRARTRRRRERRGDRRAPARHAGGVQDPARRGHGRGPPPQRQRQGPQARPARHLRRHRRFRAAKGLAHRLARAGSCLSSDLSDRMRKGVPLIGTYEVCYR